MPSSQDHDGRSDLASDTAARGLSSDVNVLLQQVDLLRHLGDELWILNDALRFVYVNRPARDGLLGTSVLDFIPPGSHDAFQRAFAAAWTPGSVETCETEWTDGSCWESRFVALPAPGDGRRMLVTTRDITVSRRAETEMRENETRLRSALDASGVGSWSWSMLTGALVWDRRMCEIWGRDAGPQSYAAYLETMHPDDLERVKAQVEKTLTSGRFEEFEHRIVRPSGEVRHLHCRAVAVVDAEGRTVGMRGGVFDITDRKLLEERLRNVQRLQAVGELTAGIAHNFNNLLGIILPSADLARSAAPEVASVHLDDIRTAAERAADMVRQLMQFGRQEAGAPKRAVDLRVIVHRLLRICQSTFEPRYVVACAPMLTQTLVHANAGELEQVLLNVCINARDALRSAKTEAPRIEVSVAAAGDAWVHVRVRDNGPGMPSEVRARIFEPFFTTKGVGSGTGLGLASAYGIVRDHGGTITCESDPGAGTTFTIALPIAPGSTLAEPVAGARAAVTGAGETILLVDDEFALRRILRIILEQAGFHILEARDGLAALELMASRGGEIDLVVLDRSMPRMSGDEFLRALQSRDVDVPVVLLTGQGGNDTTPQGAAAVLMKPPASGELVRTVCAVLDGKRS